MKKNLKIILSIVAVIIAAILIYFLFIKQQLTDDVLIKPTRGDFVISVTVAGELRAEKSIDIRGPSGSDALGIYKMTISDLIAEGTVVKEGDMIAQLDQTPVMTQIKELELSVLKYKSQFEQSQIDSTLTLSKSRDNLENLKFAMEEQKLQLEQSQYEPPAVIRQAEINLQKVERQSKQAIKNYQSEVQKTVTTLTIVGADLSREQQKMYQLMELAQEFTIRAPAAGMVVYRKSWGGNKTVVGSQISIWDPVVAKLPDLNNMQSITYVNEIDISKMQKGQKVDIRLDAIPDKKLSGTVLQVANIGENLRGSNSKVFETIIKVETKDTTLLPAMTTSNEILVNSIKNALYIPQECVHTFESDSIKYHYVLMKKGARTYKQEVILGELNSNEVIIERGIDDDDELFLTIPEDIEELEIQRLDKSKKQSTKK